MIHNPPDDEFDKEPSKPNGTHPMWFAIPTKHKYVQGKASVKPELLHGIDQIMVDILKEKGYENDFDYYLSTSCSLSNLYNEYRIMKQFTKAPRDLKEVELLDAVSGEHFKNVCFIGKEGFKAELLDTVEAFGNEPTTEHIYESLVIMVKLREQEKKTKVKGNGKKAKRAKH